MRIYGTPPSHFTRKVRVVLQELKVPYEFVVFEKLNETGPENYADNPLHLFPVLDDGDQKIFDSSVICEYLIERFGRGKELNTYLPAIENKLHDQKRLTIMNGAMSAGVTLMRSKRSGLENWDAYPFFRQEKAALAAGLRWLDKDLGSRTSYYPGRLTMLDINLQCLLEWAEFRELIVPKNEIPNLMRFKEFHAARPSFASTHPSLLEAKQ